MSLRRERMSVAGAMVASTSSITLSALPIFLLGALAVFMRAELDFSESELGIVASAYYAASALSSVPGGRISHALGGRRAVALGAVISGGSMLGIALLTHSYPVLLGFMVIAGSSNGVALPASNLVVASRIPAHHQGIAFGIKQSSGPVSTLVAGSAVPAVGLTIGWRWAWFFMALASIPLIMLGRSGSGRTHRDSISPEHAVSVAPLVLMALGAAMAVIGGSSIAAFYVESAVAAGIRPGVAGALLATGSVTGIGTRILWGAVADRSPRTHVPLLAGLLAFGSLAYVLMGRVSDPLALAAVTVLFFASGWGWPALFQYTVVSRNPGAPAIATGIVGAGLYAGGIVGPLVFGALVERSGYEVAWTYVAMSGAMSAVLFYIGGRWLELAQHR